MPAAESDGTREPLLQRLCPRAGVRAQLVSAAAMWAIGASILIVRGVYYVHDRHWHAWALAAAFATAIAVPKSRYVLDRTAARAVARIRARGRACWFGFFSWKSWLLVALMMGAGMTLRRLVVAPGEVGAGIMGALYIGIGAALAITVRVFWLAALEKPLPQPLEPVATPAAPGADSPPADS
jgi:hypothetical protein